MVATPPTKSGLLYNGIDKATLEGVVALGAAGMVTEMNPAGIVVAVVCANAVEAVMLHASAADSFSSLEGFIDVVFMRNVVG